MNSLKPVFRSAFLFLFFLSLPAQADSEIQSWTQLLSQGKLTHRLRLWAEVQPRYGYTVGGFTTLLIRPALGWQVTPDLSMWAGYAWTPLFNPISRNEHRSWVQALYAMPLFSGNLIQRLRVEARFIEGIPPSAFRLRYQVRLATPVAMESALHLLVYDEIFIALNDAGSTITTGLDQNRFFLGLYYRQSPDLGFDVGYMWNAVRRPQISENRTNHVAMVSLYYNFDITTPSEAQ